MEISLHWLQEFLPFEESAENIAERLTALGLEVESIQDYESVPGSYAGIVTGHVLSTVVHPNADKLRVCTVDVGLSDPLTIVCGAWNFEAGAKVIVSTIGATLYPLTGEPIVIQESTIRGQASQGMICSAFELGLGQDHDGILVLAEETLVGQPAADVLATYADTILTIGLTPNRTDALGHFGVARDLAAAYGTSARLPAITYHDIELDPCPVSITIEDPKRCPRYSGIVIHDIQVKESPKWLQDRLKAIGQRPVNNIVDVTNYVMFELGQPLHAFDLSEIGAFQIVVRSVEEGTAFITLDEQTRHLSPADVMICDPDRPLCIGGVMGGSQSGVNAETRSIFIESAYFDPATIRQSAKRHGIHSESAYRFMRGTDPLMTTFALKRATDLIVAIAGGKPTRMIDRQAKDLKPHPVQLRLADIERLAGVNIPEETVLEILKRLDIITEPDPNQAGCYQLKVPLYRHDVKRPQDVIEELLRVWGFEHIPPASQLRYTLVENRDDLSYAFDQKIYERLAAAGFYEIRTNSLLPLEWVRDGAIQMLNPLSQEAAALRDSMLPSGLAVIAHNLHRQQQQLRLFEGGKIYQKSTSVDSQAQYVENDQLAFYLSSNTEEVQDWKQGKYGLDYYSLKGEVARLLRWLGLSLSSRPLPETDNELIYGEEMDLDGKIVVRLGKVRVELVKRHDIKQGVFYAVFDWATLREKAMTHGIILHDLPRFPAVSRDISMLVGPMVRYQDILARIETLQHPLIKSVQVFDVFQPQDSDQRSYALSLQLQDPSKTLTEQDIQPLMEELFKALETDGQIQIRR